MVNLSDNRPIGVFDSGLGGLTVVREMQKAMPNESIVYFGDTGRVPYGTKSRDTIKLYARQDIEFLMQNNVKAIVAACGTVSSVALPELEGLPVPIEGVVVPSAIAAVKKTKNGKIGVIGTSATINSGAYRSEITRLMPDAQIFEKACPLFVPIVESGWIERDNEVAILTVKKYLSSLKDEGVDVLILGCTHFPLLSDIIGDFMGQGVELIDTGYEAAHYVLSMLKEKGIESESEQGEHRYFVSDRVDDFSSMAAILLGRDISDETQKACVDAL